MRNYLLPIILFLLLTCVHPCKVQAVDVATKSDLAAIATQCAIDGCAGMDYTLTADIDLSDTLWTPIGTAARPFLGRLDGNGHMVNGLHLFAAGVTDGVGLFGHVGQGALIERLGVNGTLVAKPKRRIGAIAGVCDGTIRQCWSMTYIAAAGTVVGGLAGELNANGTIEDCYHAGLIYNAADTIGAIVGRNNGGTLQRVYNSGYAKDGYAIVGVEGTGTCHYEDCYYDRKAYYMKPGSQDEGIIPLDVTGDLFAVFAGNATWSTSTTRYPVLADFESSNAALLSAAPMFIDTEEEDPINHADILTRDFTVSTEGGVTWACREESGRIWIDIQDNTVRVNRPCGQFEVLVNVSKGADTRVAYMNPLRLADFIPGVFNGPDEAKEFCYKAEVNLSGEITTHTLAQYGGIEAGNEYFYMVTRSVIDQNGDTIPYDTLRNENEEPRGYNAWYNSYRVPTDNPGEFVLRRYAHDEACVSDWVRSEGQYIYRVFPELKPGEIEDKRDTIYLDPNPRSVTIANITAAEGGDGNITYTWTLNGEEVAESNTPALTYSFTQKGVYLFRRVVNDGHDCGDTISAGSRTVVVFDKFEPGAVLPDNAPKIFCETAEAKDFIVSATEATGGNTPNYHYQWYTMEGGDTVRIAGAVEQNLDLGTLTLEAGKDYTFVRYAEDNTRFTTLTKSAEAQTIHIMAALKPGIIHGGQQDNYCASYDAGDAAMVAVDVEEIDGGAAEGDEGHLEYRWLRVAEGSTDTTVMEGCNANELHTSFPLDELNGKTYTYIREVRNTGCDWYRSMGEAKRYYGQDTRYKVIKTICKEHLPYTMTKNDSTHTFTADGEEWLVLNNTKGLCSEDTLFVIRTVTMPVFDIDSVAHVCQEEHTITLYYEKKAGQSDQYRVTYSDHLASIIGRKGDIGDITDEGSITLTGIPAIDANENNWLELEIGYTGDATDESDICYSDPHRLRIDFSLGGYLHTKYDRVLFVDNNPDNGIATGGENKLRFVAYQWYKDGQKLEGDTMQYYHAGGELLSGVFYVMLKTATGEEYRSCEISLTGAPSAAPLRTEVYPVPVNAGEPVTIKAYGHARLLSFSGELMSAEVPVAGQTTISAPAVTGLYYVQIRTDEGDMEMHKIIVK